MPVMRIGIDDMAAYVPHLYLPIATLAEARQWEYAKLNQGLGLTAMAVADAREDAATLAANAVLTLIERNQLDPRAIGRIYLGTESALDGAKPTATYALEMLSQALAPTYGPDCLLHCDVVDLTFACIGAVDALHNTLDWVQASPDRIGIVVASDIAKYELGSGGEYTQGAGAVAVLVRQNPRLLAIDPHWGVATRPVHDFFKPRRRVQKTQLVSEILHLANRNHVDVEALVQSLQRTIAVQGVLDSNETDLQLHRDTPVFDGPYSNDCYQQRIREALAHFAQQHQWSDSAPLATRWDRLAFHLPYAYQARRMFGEIFLLETLAGEQAEALLSELGLASFPADTQGDEWAQLTRAVTKTAAYRAFVAQKIARGEQASSLVGNLYTGSLFLSIMSTLEADLTDEELPDGASLGCFAYGSGSKSKVFQATLQPGWRQVAAGFGLMHRLQQRQAIDYDTYEQLHRGARTHLVAPQAGVFYLDHIHPERDNLEGARSYRQEGAAVAQESLPVS